MPVPWLTLGLIAAFAATVGLVILFENRQWRPPHEYGGEGPRRRRRSQAEKPPDPCSFDRCDTRPDFRGNQSKEDNCPICLDPIAYTVQVRLPCEHKLHLNCYNGLLKRAGHTCPICRHPF